VAILVDHSGTPVLRSRWRTYLVLAHTLSGSMRLVARGAVGRLQRDDVERVFKRWYGHIFDISKLTLEARGVEEASRAIPCVLVSHHVSLLDTPCVFASWPGSVRMVGKSELRKVPVFGKAMEEAGIVFVDRDDRQKAIGQLERAKQRVAEGYSLWVAAEGKRSRDGRLRAFKKGAFHIAVQLQVPLVPVWIQGTLDVIPPDQWRSATGQKVVVAYGAPVPTAGCTTADIPRLIDEVRARMLALAQDCGAPPDVDAGSAP
jgi:1-acyl-sn-glycerol-3-phosphate acyltransferase